MKDHFAFRFFEPSDSKRNSLVIFFTSKISLNIITKVLKDDITHNLVPKNVYLLTLNDSFIDLDTCKKDTSFVSEFTSYVGDINEHFHCLHSKSTGGIFLHDGSKISESFEKELLHSGMIDLFKKHSGLITSSHGYHFVKPSGDHCNKFIRASNLLVSSIEVSFLAISLLPYMTPDLKRIYVDTSSVAYLISIAIQLYGDFVEGTPSIESFESYSALKQQYDFVEDTSSLVFISATTSGSLARSLLAKSSFSVSQVITLFHVNLPKEQQGVFDVSSAISGNIGSQKAIDCDLCNLGQKLIRIAGEQFLPENPQHESLMIRKADFSESRKRFFKQFAAVDVLHWDVAASGPEDLKEHFFIDVGKAIKVKTDPFSKKLTKSLNRYISRDLSLAIVLPDPGSAAVAKEVKTYLNSNNNLTWLKAENLNEEDVNDSRSVIVICGAITSGRSLLAVSRKLRSINHSATITYFIGFSKLPTREAFEQLRKDLSQGGHEVVILCNSSVPRIKEYSKTAWDWERDKLLPFSGEDPFGEQTKLPQSLNSRYLSLTSFDDCSKNLFLHTPQGNALELRQTFAFWSDLDFTEQRFKKSSQADVYWTIQSVLHDLRNKNDDSGLATTYHSTLISPANFDRFNDGVIQAALLRSALPAELDYRVNDVLSRQMTDVICSILDNWDNAQGEGLLEFLLALWTKRLRINDKHLQELVSMKSDSMPEVIQFFLEQMEPEQSKDITNIREYPL